MSHVFCEGQEVYLRGVRLSDIPLIVQWKNDPLVHRMALGPDVVATTYSERRDIKRALKSDAEVYLIIDLKESGQPVGYVRINWMDASHRFAWLRFTMGEERGKGYCKDALRSVRVQQGKYRLT
jgi:RimJ/RimL family protein N-acetyltransferase